MQNQPEPNNRRPTDREGDPPRPHTVDRRLFLGHAAGLGAAGFLAGASPKAQTTQQQPQGTATRCPDDAVGPDSPKERRKRAFQVRRDAAEKEKNLR